MVRKVVKILFWVVGVVVGLLLLLPMLLYVPSVQNYAKNRAQEYVAQNLDATLEIKRFRVRIPFILKLESAVMISSAGDTIAAVDDASIGVKLLPLLRAEVVVRKLGLKGSVINYADTVSGMQMNIRAADVSLRLVGASLKNKELRVGDVTLEDAKVTLKLGKSLGDSVVVGPDSSAKWRVAAQEIRLYRVAFEMSSGGAGGSGLQGMDLAADLWDGDIEGCEFDLATRSVVAKLVRLDKGDCVLRLFGGGAEASADLQIAADSTVLGEDSPPWSVQIGRVLLNDNSFMYSRVGSKEVGEGATTAPSKSATRVATTKNISAPLGIFDPNNIYLSGIYLALDSVSNRGVDVSARVVDMRFREKCGFELTTAQGEAYVSKERGSLVDMAIKTPNSDIKAKIDLVSHLSDINQDSQAELLIEAGLGMKDVLFFAPQMASVVKRLEGDRIYIVGKISTGSKRLNVSQLSVSLPGRIWFDMNGLVEQPNDKKSRSGRIQFLGNLKNANFLLGFIPDQALRRRLELPGRVDFGGEVEIQGGLISPDLYIYANSGQLTAQGSVNLATERYGIDIASRNFPLGKILPTDSLGNLTARLTARGEGFDFTGRGAESDIKLSVGSLEYKRYDYRNIDIDAVLANNRLNGRVTSDSDALELDLELRGEFSPARYAAGVKGQVRQIKLSELNFANRQMDVRFNIDASAEMFDGSTSSLIASLALDSIFLGRDGGVDRVGLTTVDIRSGSTGVSGRAKSGDLLVEFRSPTTAESFPGALSLFIAEANRQIGERSVDMERLQGAMMPLRLRVSVGEDNILHSLALAQGLSFESFRASASTGDSLPFSMMVALKKFNAGGVDMDSVGLNMDRVGDRLNFAVQFSARTEAIKDVTTMSISGGIGGTEADVRFVRKNSLGELGFNLGLVVALSDSAVRVSVDPLDPIMVSTSWRANEGNFFTYCFNKQMYANLRLDGNGQFLHLRSDMFAGVRPGAVSVSTDGIDLGKMLAVLPSAPPVKGVLGANVRLGFDYDVFSIAGDLTVAELAYDDKRIGDLRAHLGFDNDDQQRQQLNANLWIDTTQIIEARGIVEQGGDITLRAEKLALPLSLANLFLDEHFTRFSGVLQGNITAVGKSAKLKVNGELRFVDAGLDSPAMGFKYKFSDHRLVIDDSKLSFNDFALLAPDGSKLSVGGTLNVADFKNVIADVSVFAADFKAVNSAPKFGSQLYGNAEIDVDITAKGPLSSLVVRGDVELLRSTNITYVLQNSPLDLKSEKQEIVTFVSFADTTAVAALVNSKKEFKPILLDINLGVSIAEGVKATLYLSDDGKNRLELIGGGRMAYTINRQGDTGLAGRYNISGGKVVYSPPLITQKTFNINSGSYAEWTDDMMNPTLNISAVGKLRTTVETDGKPSTVNFDIIARVSNSLKELEIAFDLAAPDNQIIGSQLASLPQEQRSNQAISLMLYNRYTGPGTTAKGDGNNTLNTFVEKELNNWARNTLQGVDVSFGINSRNDSSQESGGHYTNYSYKVSKTLFDDRVKVSVGGSVRTDTDVNKNVEENLVDDISIEYSLTKRDNMYLKLYRYNTRESVLEGQITESGVGFGVRKRMNKLNELFKLSRAPQKRAEIKENREKLREEKLEGTLSNAQ